MTKEEFLQRLEIAKAWAEGKKVRRKAVIGGYGAWHTLNNFSISYIRGINFFDDRVEFELVREPKVIWVNEYTGGEQVAHSSKEMALGGVIPGVIRTAIRYIEDMTDE